MSVVTRRGGWGKLGLLGEGLCDLSFWFWLGVEKNSGFLLLLARSQGVFLFWLLLFVYHYRTGWGWPGNFPQRGWMGVGVMSSGSCKLV